MPMIWGEHYEVDTIHSRQVTSTLIALGRVSQLRIYNARPCVKILLAHFSHVCGSFISGNDLARTRYAFERSSIYFIVNLSLSLHCLLHSLRASSLNSCSLAISPRYTGDLSQNRCACEQQFIAGSFDRYLALSKIYHA
jgi:hypothetical protein